MPDVELNEVIFCARDGQRWRVQFRGLFLGDFRNANYITRLAIQFHRRLDSF